MNFDILKMVCGFLLLFSFLSNAVITILVKSNFYDYIELRKEPY